MQGNVYRTVFRVQIRYISVPRRAPPTCFELPPPVVAVELVLFCGPRNHRAALRTGGVEIVWHSYQIARTRREGKSIVCSVFFFFTPCPFECTNDFLASSILVCFLCRYVVWQARLIHANLVFNVKASSTSHYCIWNIKTANHSVPMHSTPTDFKHKNQESMDIK